MLLAITLSACALPAAGNDEAHDYSLVNAKNYEDPLGPKFEGRYAPEPSPFDGNLVVVTFNIKEGERVAQAGEALKEMAPLDEAGVVLLQEMDEAGVDEITRQLAMNYVYYPAFVSRDGRNVGNAILSRYTLHEPRKIILPGANPISGQRRIAVAALLDLGISEMLPVYSVHTETYASLPGMRTIQLEAIVDDIGTGDLPVVVGGDFNTVSSRSIRRMIERFKAAGLKRVSSGSGPTITKLGLSPVAADHIFARGFAKEGAGKVKEVQASDHFPVWARLAMDKKFWRPEMSDRKESLFVIVYDGQETADEVYDVLRGLEKEKKIDIKSAATVTRGEGTKLNLDQKRFLTGGKGAVGGGIIGLLLAGTGVGLLAGALIGAVIGGRGRNDRQDLKDFLVDKMGPFDSTLAILVADADWEAVQDAVAQYGGEELAIELTPGAQAQLQELAADEEVAAAVEAELKTGN
jgi:endonuclease/exonuclease/phosphatase family metal-dependent hydrolase/uncharacterized membrane protein